MQQILFWRSSGKSSRRVQWAGFISQHLEQKIPLSISGLFQKKQARWLRKCHFKYSTEVAFVLEVLENSKVIASELPQKCVTPLENPPSQNRRPLDYVAFLLNILADFTPSQTQDFLVSNHHIYRSVY